MKIQFGSGSNRLPGWINTDAEVDIGKPLPFPSGGASHVFAEHVLEHVTHQQAWRFLEECHRILLPGGKARIAIPDVNRIWLWLTPDYREAVRNSAGHLRDGSPRSCIEAAVFDHGHQAAWNVDLLMVFMKAIGFRVALCNFGESSDSAFQGIEGHGKVVGEEIAKVETSIVEGTKL